MSTLKSINLQHPSSVTPSLVLSSTGNVQGAGLDLIVASTFTAQSAVSINNCFSSVYENYLVQLNMAVAVGVGIYGYVRLRAGGVDNTTASSYVTQETSMYTTTVAAIRSTSAEARSLCIDASYETSAALTFYRPYSAVPTKIFSDSFYGYLNASLFKSVAVHTVSSSFDGFTFYPASSSITGTVYVYGYRMVA